MEYIVFAIDNNTDTHTVAKFLRHMDTAKAMGKMTGNMVHGVGYWEGILKPTYIVNRDDYKAHVAGSGYVDGQDGVLVAPHGTRQPAHVATADLSTVLTGLGPIQEVPKEEVHSWDAWTFNMTSGRYFAA